MTKVALLVGVSEYQLGLTPLPKARQDIDAMQRALQDHQTDGFDQIKVLLDPDPQTMRVEIETLFAGRSRDDLVLLFFSGHGIKDDQGKLYFATRDTRKTPAGTLIRATALEAGFVHELMSNSRCRHQVVILDCCFSGAFAAGMEAKDSGVVDIAGQLGGEGRVVLTSSTATQYSFEEQSADLSIYTRYIVEGLETGAADLNHDGWIEVEELHDYAKGKVQETAPAMKPEIYAVKEGYKIRLARARVGDPTLRYRQEADRYARRGEISAIGRIILDTLRGQLGISAEAAAQIEVEVLSPYRERLENLQRYREALLAAVQVEYPFSEQTQADLQHLQELLGLRDEDVAPIAAEIAAQVSQVAERHQQQEEETLRHQQEAEQRQQEIEKQRQEQEAKELQRQRDAEIHQQHLDQYQRAFSEAVEQKFPLSQDAQDELQQLQQILQLTQADLLPIEPPILARKEAEYTQQLAAERLRQQRETERAQQEIEQERQQTQQEATYQQKLRQYEQILIDFLASGLSLESGYVRDRLQQLQCDLKLRDTDIAAVVGKVIGQHRAINQQPGAPSNFWMRWVRTNIVGWILGVYAGVGAVWLIIITLSHLESSTTVPISLILGCVVGWTVIGLTQGLFIRKQIHGNGWIWATLVGGAVGGAVSLIPCEAAFRTQDAMLLVVSAVVGIVVSAGVSGLIQERILNSQIRHFDHRWIWMNVLGWVLGLAGGIAASLASIFLVATIVGPLFRTLTMAFAVGGVVGGAVGGAVYGGITGRVLVRLLQQSARK